MLMLAPRASNSNAFVITFSSTFPRGILITSNVLVAVSVLTATSTCLRLSAKYVSRSFKPCFPNLFGQTLEPSACGRFVDFGTAQKRSVIIQSQTLTTSWAELIIQWTLSAPFV